MAQFELLDAILNEGTANVQDTDEYVTESDSALYANIDQLVEGAMRETLRNTILESAIDDSTKLNHIEVIESANFSDEQVLSFMESTINPILDVAGFLDESHDLGGIDPIAVSAPVYEAALAIHLNSMDELSEAVLASELVEAASELDGSDQEEFINENFGMVSTGDSNSLYKQIFESAGSETDVLQDAFAHIFEKYEMDETEAEMVVSEAVEFLETYGVENLQLDMGFIAEAVVEYNALAESNGYATFGVVLEDLNYLISEVSNAEAEKAGREARQSAIKKNNKMTSQRLKANVIKPAGEKVGKAYKSIRTKTVSLGKAIGDRSGKAWAAAKEPRATGKAAYDATINGAKKVWGKTSDAGKSAWDGVKNPGRTAKAGWKATSDFASGKYAAGKEYAGKNKVKVAGGTVAIAAVATAAMIAYKKFKTRECPGLSGEEKSKCMKMAAAQGLKAAKAQARTCGSDEKCMKSAKAEISKWESKVANA